MATIATLLSLFSLIASATTRAEAGDYYGWSRQGAHHATSYGGRSDASATFGGAPRNQNLNSEGYGSDTAELFNDRLSCGPCSGIKCANGPHWCTSIFVSSTNFVTNDNGGPHQPHFHLAMPMFLNNDENRLAFKYFNLVLIANVEGAGDDMVRVSVKGTTTGWMPLSRNSGQNRQLNAVLVGQSLSFRVTGGDGRTTTFRNVVPSTWQLGQTSDGENTHSPVPKIPKHVPHRKLYWRSGPGFGTQSLPSELQAPESEAPSPNPSP